MDKSDITLDRIRIFVRVAERGNLSAVARELRVGQSTVTRQLRELEQALGVALLHRTTRRVALTDEGRRYYADNVEILRMIDLSVQDVRAAGDNAVGTVRISCTAALGVLHVTRLVFAFQDRHPGISVDLGLTDERVNLVERGVDVALRLGPLTDSSMKLRSLGQAQRQLVAAPEYLASRGVPRDPRDLHEHEGIRMSNVAGSDEMNLTGPDGALHVVPFGGRLRVDHGLAARQALLAGRGIAPAPRWLVADLLDQGRLVPVLPGYLVPSVPLNLLIVPGRADVARVRLLVDWLSGQAATIPGILR